MIILANNSSSLLIDLDAAMTTNHLQWSVCWQGVTTSFGSGNGIIDDVGYTASGVTSGTTAVEMVPAPETNTATAHYSRQIKYISVYNADSVSTIVTIRIYDGTDRNQIVVTIAAGSQLHYEDSNGWYVLDSTGGVLSTVTSGAALPILLNSKIWVGDATNAAVAQAPSGDVSMTNTGVFTLVASINKAISGIWSFVSAKFRLYNSASTFYTSVETVATANNVWTVPNTGSQTFASEAYADAKVTDAIVDAVTTVAPSQNAVFDALALKQPLDSDLTTIAGLTPTTDNFIQSKSGAWASRTVAEVYTDLQPSVKGDVYFTFLCLYGGTTPLADSSVWHFLNSGISPTAANTDTNNDFNFGYAVNLIAATIITFGNTTAGTSENVTLALRNTTQATTTTIGTFTTSGGSATVVVNTTINGLNIAIASSDFFTLRVTNPVWVTNPIAAVYRVLLTFKRV